MELQLSTDPPSKHPVSHGAWWPSMVSARQLGILRMYAPALHDKQQPAQTRQCPVPTHVIPMLCHAPSQTINPEQMEEHQPDRFKNVVSNATVMPGEGDLPRTEFHVSEESERAAFRPALDETNDVDP